MGFRIQKRKQLIPGVRLNISKSGFGVSVGKPGARMSINPKGEMRSTVGIPGTGLSHSQKINKSKKARESEPSADMAETSIDTDKLTELHEALKHLGIHQWWTTELSAEEQLEIIEAVLQSDIKLNWSSETLVDDKFIQRADSAGGYLLRLNCGFNNPQLSIKIARKAKALLDETDLKKLELWEFTQMHFQYQVLLSEFYPQRDNVPGALDDAMDCCKRMIRISPEVIKDPEIKLPPANRLPAHKGYEQLAIIAEKQKNYPAAIKISKLAESQGWDGDWQRRVERCETKMAKVAK